MNTVIILAGGTGTRVGADRPKQFIEVLGKPILAYTCNIFETNANIDAIEIVCHHDWIDYCRTMCDTYNLTKVRWIVPGGETFQDSVINGVKHLESLLDKGETNLDDNVFIQYGGAPFTSQRIVDAVIEMTAERGSAVTATPCFQLLSERTTDTTSDVWCDRDEYIQIACPYGFRFSYLLDIYKRSAEQGLLEKIEPHTTSLMYALGETINYTYGDQTNLKITTAEDVEMFEGYVLAQKKKQTLCTKGDVIVMLADGFEECEALLVVDLLRRAGLSVVTASIMNRREVSSSRNILITADCLAEDVDYAGAKLLVLPGGRDGTANLKNCELVASLCKQFAKDKMLAAVCAAPTIPASLGLMKQATVHPDFQDQMCDVTVSGDAVVVDDNIITGKGLGATIPFALKLIELLVDEKTAKQIKDAICYEA
ncbi:MAG: DJ-1/PfpI family protein [Eubacterium sp.]|nr:DJ-1/PfpI family protein [Eubacterium sp.]